VSVYSLYLAQLTHLGKGCALLQCLGNSALHPSGVTKLSTSFGWGKGGNFTSAGLQVTLCDPMWHLSSCSGKAGLLTEGEPVYRVYLLTYCCNINAGISKTKETLSTNSELS